MEKKKFLQTLDGYQEKTSNNDSFDEISLLSNMRGSIQENPYSLPKLKQDSKYDYAKDERSSIHKKNYDEILSTEIPKKNNHLDSKRNNIFNEKIERKNYHDNGSIEKKNINSISNIDKEDIVSRIMSLERDEKRINLHNNDVKKILDKNHDSEKSMIERIYGYRANKQRREISPLQRLLKARQK